MAGVVPEGASLLTAWSFDVLPAWLVVGLAIGAVVSALIAVVFYVGDRLFPPAEPAGHRVDGTQRRRAEIRRYLAGIDERFREEYVVEELTIAFYLPERDVAITFDPRVFFRLEPTDTFVVLCEDEMPAAHLGSRLPFEVPVDAGQPRGAPTPSVAVAAAYDELGLQPGASPEAVRSAYRERAKQTHPDRGGSDAAFKQLQEAYTTVRNHAERSPAQ